MSQIKALQISQTFSMYMFPKRSFCDSPLNIVEKVKLPYKKIRVAAETRTLVKDNQKNTEERKKHMKEQKKVEATTREALNKKHDNLITGRVISHLKKHLHNEDLVINMGFQKCQFSNMFLQETPNKLLLFHGVKESEYKPISHKKNISPRLLESELDLQYFYKSFYKHLKLGSNDTTDPITSKIQQHYEGCSDIKVVGAVNSTKFIMTLGNCYANSASFFENHSPTFYLVVPLEIAKTIKHPSSANTIIGRNAVFVSWYFNIEQLDQFYLYHTNTEKELIAGVLLKLTYNKEFLEEIGKESLPSFNFFVNTFSRTIKNQCLVMQLGSLLPNSGKVLIDNGFKMYKTVYDWKPKDWIKAFKLLSARKILTEDTFSDLQKAYVRKFFGSK